MCAHKESASKTPCFGKEQKNQEKHRLLLDLSELSLEVSRLTKALSDCEGKLREAQSQCRAIEKRYAESIAYLLGTEILRGFSSPRAFIRLPFGLFALLKVASRRKKHAAQAKRSKETA